MSFSEFVKPYPNGYEDGESGNTPVTAAILNTNYDGFLLALNSWASEMETSLNQKADTSAVGQAISTISGRLVNMQDAINQKSTVSISDLLGTGTHIGTITVNGTDFALYAPSGGGGGSSVAWNQLQQTGTKIAEITIDGTDYDVYAPDPIDELSDLTDVSITNLQNGQILKWNATTSKWENSNESGGGGAGHTILDDDGTVLAQEDDLQFKGVYSTDNSEDGVTEVNVYREMTKAEFDLLSADEKKGFIRVTDEPDIYSDGHFQPVIYSTEEREIGVWTDGKPLYEKTLAIPSLSAGSNTIQHNIANFDKMISCQGRINYDGDDLVVPYMQTQVTSGYVAYGIGISNFNSTRYFIILGNMFDVSKFSGGYVTVRYTKSTDIAGSGSWTPQGVPTHHYSTDEQIVGTWIDGSTLYEKTIDCGYLPSTTIKGVSTGVNGIGLVTKVNGFAYSSGDVINIPYIESNNASAKQTIDVWHNRSLNELKINTNFDASGFYGYITIQYTKSS